MSTARESLNDVDPDILCADGFDAALIGWTDSWSGHSRAVRAVYSVEKCIAILQQQGMSIDEAEEYFEFNTAGAYVGEHTPVFVHFLNQGDHHGIV